MMEPLPNVDDHDLMFVDTETTGRSGKTAVMVEVFACWCSGQSVDAVAYLHMMCNPGIKMPRGAYNTHKIEPWQYANAPDEEAVCKALHWWLDPRFIIIGHNLRVYDMAIITRHGYEFPNLIIDTMEMARAAFPGQCNTQPALIKRFGLKLEHCGHAHRARYDVMMNRLIYLRLRKLVNPNDFLKRKDPK